MVEMQMDELIDPNGAPRPLASAVMDLIARLGEDELRARQELAELDIQTMGITFTVYSDGQNIDRSWPFDIIPRIIEGSEWDRISLGLQQRLVALNRFIDDLYNDQRIIADGVFPADLLD
ncbi:MAG: circularly permuted type 2 ATP-grasp protein, partial [Ilumatobacter fluminis]